MTAYRNNFLVVKDTGSISSGEGSGPSNISNRYEPMLIGHELLTTNDGDIILAEVKYVTQ